MRSSTILAVSSFALACAAGCGRADDPAKAHADPATASAAVAASSAPTAQQVTQIVFIDKENCCECTKNRTDATWTALQTALGPGSHIQVTRVHLDTQPDLAKEYLRSKPLMVPPGIYFMSLKGDLVEMLQGEVTAPQISAVLTKK